MTPPDSGTLDPVERIARALEAHPDVESMPSAKVKRWFCSGCSEFVGADTEIEATYRAHLARAVWPVVNELIAEAKAEALDGLRVYEAGPKTGAPHNAVWIGTSAGPALDWLQKEVERAGPTVKPMLKDWRVHERPVMPRTDAHEESPVRTYFDTVRSLTRDPDVLEAVDKAEAGEAVYDAHGEGGL